MSGNRNQGANMTLTERRTGTKSAIVCAHILAANRDGGCLITSTCRE